MMLITNAMIQSFSLFEGLPQNEIEAITHSATQKIIKAKTVFIEQGASSEAAYFILEGSVNVYRMNENGEEVSLAVLGQGDVVGEMALIDHEPRSAYVKSLTDISVLVLTSSDFKNILQKYPNTAIHLLSSLSVRIRQTDQHVEDILTQNLATRTWNSLLVLKRYFPDGEIALSHEELSSIIGATRARVTEVLNLLQEQGKITLSHRKIILTK